jgi:hypothetical protein
MKFVPTNIQLTGGSDFKASYGAAELWRNAGQLGISKADYVLSRRLQRNPVHQGIQSHFYPQSS